MIEILKNKYYFRIPKSKGGPANSASCCYICYVQLSFFKVCIILTKTLATKLFFYSQLKFSEWEDESKDESLPGVIPTLIYCTLTTIVLLQSMMQKSSLQIFPKTWTMQELKTRNFIIFVLVNIQFQKMNRIPLINKYYESRDNLRSMTNLKSAGTLFNCKLLTLLDQGTAC